jgi:plasmid stabilization system protein ParE
VARLTWSTAARGELADLLIWLAVNRSTEVAEDARLAVEAAALRAAQRPLAYPWVGAVLPSLARTGRAYRRVLAWERRLHVYYRVLSDDDAIVILHVRGSRQRPLGARRLADR